MTYDVNETHFQWYVLDFMNETKRDARVCPQGGSKIHLKRAAKCTVDARAPYESRRRYCLLYYLA